MVFLKSYEPCTDYYVPSIRISNVEVCASATTDVAVLVMIRRKNVFLKKDSGVSLL
jgi:hypothetical protein